MFKGQLGTIREIEENYSWKELDSYREIRLERLKKEAEELEKERKKDEARRKREMERNTRRRK